MVMELVVSNFKRAFFQQMGSLIRSKSDYVEEDCISQLPDEMLALILSHLTFRDAVKTRVLGRRWRHLDLSYLYSARSELNFDRVWAGIPRDYSYSCQTYAHAFVQDVNGFLKQYKGPYITSFAVYFCLCEKYSSDIDRWITYAVKLLGVEELKICLQCSEELNLLYLYSFSFRHLSEAYGLKRLELSSCILKPDFDGQFHSLKFLKLSRIKVNQSILQYILSKLCSLEELSISRCTCPTVLSFHATLLPLKTLAIYYCLGLEEIGLSITNLTTLNVDWLCKRFNIVFSSAPNLKNFHFLKLYGNRFPGDVFDVIKDAAQQLQSLSICSQIIMVETIPSSIPTFHNLKHLHMELHLTERCGAFDIRKIIPLVIACPLLEIFTLTIKQTLYIGGRADSAERRTMREIPECRPPHLKEVELYGFQATENQLELALYLLRNGVALERMIITPFWKLFRGEYGKFCYEKHRRVPWTNKYATKNC